MDLKLIQTVLQSAHTFLAHFCVTYRNLLTWSRWWYGWLYSFKLNISESGHTSRKSKKIVYISMWMTRYFISTLIWAWWCYFPKLRLNWSPSLCFLEHTIDCIKVFPMTAEPNQPKYFPAWDDDIIEKDF